MSLVHLDRIFMTSIERVGLRERERAELTFRSAAKTIIDRLDSGEGLRKDGFFEKDGPRDSDAEEIFEGILRAACEDHEQRKAERLGELYAHFAFSTQITTAHASYLIELARRLTHQQLLLLGVFATEDNGVPSWRSFGGLTHTNVGIVMSILNLAQMGLIVRRDGKPILSFLDINPSEMQTFFNGSILTEAMSLKEARRGELATTLDALDRLGKVVFPAPDGEPPRSSDESLDENRIRLEDLPEPRFPLTRMVDQRRQGAAPKSASS
jgi:hypothetical protein